MRDIKADMKAALVQEYEGYVRAGRSAEADQVAKVLKDQYGHDVAKTDGDGAEKEAKAEPKPAPERADAEKPPEAAVEPKPRRGRPPKQADDAQSSSK
ncbi:hypothetical protein [Streptomyces asiaticus]|uniref:hypothetical protein n=1 Tax=Streptomyces asiaticus TaxID=114695 RepID=UPI001BA7436F|nr:hypothetical protein [Streptomyces asiaticus]